MTWRRITRAQARAEALAEFRDQVRTDIESSRFLRQLLEQDDARRQAAYEATRPLLRDMSSAQILEALHSSFGDGTKPLPCDEQDVFAAVLEELERRKTATAHERLRLRELDRKS